MKITIIGGPFQPMPPAPCGAVERIWHGLAEEFTRRGHEVTVLCRVGGAQVRDESINGVRYVRRGEWVRTPRLGINLFKDLVHSGRVFVDLPRADILVTNSFWLPALLSVWNPDAGRIAVHVQRMPKRQFGLYPAVHRFQTVSTAIRDALVSQRPGLRSRVRLFPNPIDTRILTPPREGRDGRPPQTILYTGRIHPEKGLDLLVAAFAILAPEFPSLRLRLVGPWRVEHGGGGEDYRNALQNRALGPGVVFGEPVFDPRGLAAEYQAADFFCYPSVAEQGEASPVAPVEAMATGLCPVVSALPQFRDTVSEGVCGVVFNHRAADPVAELANALRGLVADPARTKRLGEAAAVRAAEFGYGRVADLYLEDFARMLRVGGRRRWAASAN